MATATKTITRNSGAKITVKITRSVVDDTAFADGYNIKLGRKTSDSLDITIITPDGKKAYGWQISKCGQTMQAKGAYAQVGNAYISEDAYNEIMAAIAELDAELVAQDPEYAMLKQAEIKAEANRQARAEENLNRMAAEQAAHEAQPGWCRKCHDWTYGDCGH
jgi:hypothetical protein